MGYRSDVFIRCRAGAYRRIIEACNKTGVMPDEVETVRLFDGTDESYVMKFFDIKWYTYDDNIKAIEDVMDWLDQYEPDWEPDFEDSPYNLAYTFLELGEEDTDIRRRQNSYELDLFVERVVKYGLAYDAEAKTTDYGDMMEVGK